MWLFLQACQAGLGVWGHTKGHLHQMQEKKPHKIYVTAPQTFPLTHLTLLQIRLWFWHWVPLVWSCARSRTLSRVLPLWWRASSWKKALRTCLRTARGLPWTDARGSRRATHRQRARGWDACWADPAEPNPASPSPDHRGRPAFQNHRPWSEMRADPWTETDPWMGILQTGPSETSAGCPWCRSPPRPWPVDVCWSAAGKLTPNQLRTKIETFVRKRLISRRSYVFRVTHIPVTQSSTHRFGGALLTVARL